MKTTIDISDSILLQAKRCRRGTTVKALVELGLRRVIAEMNTDSRFVFEPVTDKLGAASGHSPPLPWEQMHDLIYEDRGTLRTGRN
jgi:Bacterial antitoxin of type II TA system, VapB